MIIIIIVVLLLPLDLGDNLIAVPVPDLAIADAALDLLVVEILVILVVVVLLKKECVLDRQKTGIKTSSRISSKVISSKSSISSSIIKLKLPDENLTLLKETSSLKSPKSCAPAAHGEAQLLAAVRALENQNKVSWRGTAACCG